MWKNFISSNIFQAEKKAKDEKVKKEKEEMEEKAKIENEAAEKKAKEEKEAKAREEAEKIKAEKEAVRIFNLEKTYRLNHNQFYRPRRKLKMNRLRKRRRRQS